MNALSKLVKGTLLLSIFVSGFSVFMPGFGRFGFFYWFGFFYRLSFFGTFLTTVIMLAVTVFMSVSVFMSISIFMMTTAAKAAVEIIVSTAVQSASVLVFIAVTA